MRVQGCQETLLDQKWWGTTQFCPFPGSRDCPVPILVLNNSRDTEQGPQTEASQTQICITLERAKTPLRYCQASARLCGIGALVAELFCSGFLFSPGINPWYKVQWMAEKIKVRKQSHEWLLLGRGVCHEEMVDNQTALPPSISRPLSHHLLLLCPALEETWPGLGHLYTTPHPQPAGLDNSSRSQLHAWLRQLPDKQQDQLDLVMAVRVMERPGAKQGGSPAGRGLWGGAVLCQRPGPQVPEGSPQYRLFMTL